VHPTPGGRVVASLGTRSDFGSPLVLAVAAQRGNWLAVRTPALPNGRLGWITAGAGAGFDLRGYRHVITPAVTPVVRASKTRTRNGIGLFSIEGAGDSL